MTGQKILRVGLLLAGVAIAGPAWAQTANFSNRFPQSLPQATARVTPSAPVVRRQPRAADVPPAADNATNSIGDPQALEDEALNRKISGICRGC